MRAPTTLKSDRSSRRPSTDWLLRNTTSKLIIRACKPSNRKSSSKQSSTLSFRSRWRSSSTKQLMCASTKTPTCTTTWCKAKEATKTRPKESSRRTLKKKKARNSRDWPMSMICSEIMSTPSGISWIWGLLRTSMCCSRMICKMTQMSKMIQSSGLTMLSSASAMIWLKKLSF